MVVDIAQSTQVAKSVLFELLPRSGHSLIAPAAAATTAILGFSNGARVAAAATTKIVPL